ncbi:outer membrane protein assembly factor BamA [Ollibium composti]|uniref:Outer membrane protein assembly factor BamA n=1 Tax=Ollibium composti TaxID=2675109 RepID=A0ABY2QCY0_9HYPH|nr:outer membrane protein assembly factor BamA [Mesorhizobium composti]THF59970.1 outer membrane protein assembly factor BamA [Mesorhizobium composti]
MKAVSKLLSAASAAALSAALVVPGAVVVQFAAVSSAEAAVVSRVEVRGNTRVEAETIRNYIQIKPGKSFSSGDVDQAVKALFGTGLFSDVQINQVGSALVVTVSEYKVVNQVLFQGNKKLKDAQLANTVQLKPRSSFSQATLDADVEAVKAAYAHIGRDDANVTTQIMDLGDNRVNVVFNINEGGRTKIAAINFVGNHAYSSRRLADIINTKRSSMLSFMLRDDVFDENKLKADEELLRRFYYNHGYADFQVVSAFGELNDQTNEYTVTITVNEGDRYTFGDVSVDSTIPELDSKSLESVVESRKGDVYSAKDVENSIIALTEKVAGQGYAFAQVTPRGDRNFENHTISVVYTVDQGTKAYVERIEIRGNTRTRDYVIRREFDVSEGDAFNQVLIQRAKKRLEALDFFEKVDISTAPGSEPDQVVLVVDVVEKATGEFSIGAGYSTGGDTPGASIQGSITERNFLGRGQFIRVSAGGGKHSRDYGFSFTEPYFLGQRIAAGFDVFRSTREYDDYDVQTTGGTVRFGLPITSNITTQVAYNISEEKYSYDDNCDANDDGVPDAGCYVSKAIQDGIENSPWLKSSVSANLIYNTIDDTKNPHYGIYANLGAEFAGLGGDAKYYKLTARASVYQTLSEEMDIVGLVSGGAGYIAGYGDNDLRVFDHFQSTDRIIRGFDFNGIGPAAYKNGIDGAAGYDHLGGTTYFNASVEAQFPLPIVPESLGLRGAVFADAATLYGNKVDRHVGTPEEFQIVSSGMKWRASAGVSLIWASPFGPLRVDYAVPLAKQDTDDVQEFNFGISTRF